MSVNDISQLPKVTLSPESLLWKAAPAQGKSDNHKSFTDQQFCVWAPSFSHTDLKVTFSQLCWIYPMSSNFAAEASLAGKVGYSMFYMFLYLYVPILFSFLDNTVCRRTSQFV